MIIVTWLGDTEIPRIQIIIWITKIYIAFIIFHNLSEYDNLFYGPAEYYQEYSYRV